METEQMITSESSSSLTRPSAPHRGDWAEAMERAWEDTRDLRETGADGAAARRSWLEDLALGQGLLAALAPRRPWRFHRWIEP